jgi:Kef-type K+ transport system membrane component KefB
VSNEPVASRGISASFPSGGGWAIGLALVAGLLVVGPRIARAAEDGHGGGSHSDPFTFVLFEFAVILGVAVLGRYAAGLTKQSAVLGELLAGVVVGNVGYWLGIPIFQIVMHLGDAGQIFNEVWLTGVSVSEAASQVLKGPAAERLGPELVALMTGSDGPRLIQMAAALAIFSKLGVIVLLFMVGLEASVGEMKKVGASALAVAIVGVVAPFALGFGVIVWLEPDQSTPAHLFVAATLCATSVGITARVFKDLGRLQTSEAKVILGAAVIDDVLGLVILAVVVGIVSTGALDLGHAGRITLLATAFLGAVVLFGERLVRALAPLVESIDRHQGKLLFPLSLCFVLSFVANQIELAAIVGAFAAGLIVSDEHFTGKETMEELVRPIEAIFAPVFFVLMGMQVNLAAFADPSTLLLALSLTVVAIAGKLVSGWAAGSGRDRISVGIGMVPRGEVGLIFASIGKSLGVVDEKLFSAIVVMVMLTTLATPLGLRWSLYRRPEQSKEM